MTRVVLLAHGSNDPLWGEPFRRMTELLRRDVGSERVELAYLEFAPPSLLEVARRAAMDGERRLRVVPLFLSAGAHVRRDIPRRIREVTRWYPELEIEVTPPIGDDDRIRRTIEAVVRELL